MMQYSSDGGYTWSAEYWREIGKAGQHKREIYYDRLGMARDRIFKIVITDPVKVVLSDAWLDVDEGRQN